jgi:hypothetical protein
MPMRESLRTVDAGPMPSGPMRRGMGGDEGMTLGPRGGFARAGGPGGPSGGGGVPAPRGAPPAPLARPGASAAPRGASAEPPPPRDAPAAAASAAPVAPPPPPEPLSEEAYGEAAQKLAEYFADDHDAAAAEEGVRALGAPARGEALLQLLFTHALGKKAYDWPALNALVLRLTAAAAPATAALPPAVALRGLRRLLDALDDLACDAPSAPARLGALAGALVQAGRLSLADVAAEALASEGPDPDDAQPDFLRSSGLALPLLAATLRGVADAAGGDAAGEAALLDAWRSARLELRAFIDEPPPSGDEGDAQVEAAAAKAGLAGLFPLGAAGRRLRAGLASGEEPEALRAALEEAVPKSARDDPDFARLVVGAVMAQAAPPTEPAAVPAEVAARYGVLMRSACGGKASLQVAAVRAAQALCEKAGHPKGLGTALLDALYDAEVVSLEALTRWTDDARDASPAKIAMLKEVNRWLMDTKQADEAEASDDEE